MKRVFIFVFILLISAPVFSEVQFRLYNSGYAYNDEQGHDWEYTQGTLTYFEDLVQPYFYISEIPGVEFRLGSGFLIPFNQNEKILDYYPYVQSKFLLGNYSLIVGSLENNHDFAPFMMDPIVNITPQNRVPISENIPSMNPTNTMSFYEYGGQLKYKDDNQKADFYMNWQNPDTESFRERFDVGVIYSYDMFYVAGHYWHNGGHEHTHVVNITENYNGAAGLKNETFSLLYTASYWLPDRDSNPQLNVFGQAFYGEYNFKMWEFLFTVQAFVSDQFIITNHQYISIEGDPFYRPPLYIGFNIHRTIKFTDEIALTFGFVNGTFLPAPDVPWNMDIRYDQELKADMEYRFDLIK